MKDIIMMISKDGRHHTITMDVMRSSTPTGNHTIEYKDPLLYDTVDRTKYIHFSDYVIPNIWEVARRIVDDLRLSHPGYVFRIAPDTDRNVIAIHAVYLADVKETKKENAPMKVYFKDVTDGRYGPNRRFDLNVSKGDGPSALIHYTDPFTRDRHMLYVVGPYNDSIVCRNIECDLAERHTDYRFKTWTVVNNVNITEKEIRGQAKECTYEACAPRRIKPVGDEDWIPMRKLLDEYCADTFNRDKARNLITKFETYYAMDKFEKERKTMKPKTHFDKVVVNGPATIGFKREKFYGIDVETKKYIIKKADGDAYDIEKAFLMLYAKSQFDSDEKFHKWFKVNMKQFREAYNEAHPDIGELPVVDGATISKNINASLERMRNALLKYKDSLNSIYGKASVDDNIIVKKSNKWTEEEEDFLRRHYKTSNLVKLAMVLGRSEAAVKAKAHRLGLDKKEE